MFPTAAQPAALTKKNSASLSQQSAPAATSTVSNRSPRGAQFGSRTSPRNNAAASSGVGNGSFNSTSIHSRSQLDAAGGSSSATTRRRSSQEHQNSSDDDDEDILDVEVMDASIPPLGMENRQVAWLCGTCQYCILAMDNKGKTLPIGVNAWGQPIPLQCPRCLVSHTNWTVTTPFDAYGDHVNIRGTFANSLQFRQHNAQAGGLPPRPPPHNAVAPTAGANVSHSNNNVGTQRLSSSSAPPIGASLLENLPPILANIGLVTYRGGIPRSTVPVVPPQRKQRTAYFCGLCSRRLLRMDHNGDLVPLDTNAGGEILPLTCPGCGVSHGDWPIRPT